MRVYEGLVDEGGGRVVLVDGDDLPPRLDLANHSPAGLNWGYGGSGPAQLALAILADHFKHHPEDMAFARCLKERRGGAPLPHEELDTFEVVHVSKLGMSSSEREGERLAVRCHQHFKGAYVAALDMSTSWRIDSDGVSEILMRMANHGIPNRFDREEPV